MSIFVCPECGGHIDTDFRAEDVCEAPDGDLICVNCFDDRNEAAYEAWQERLRESGRPDDSAYRRNMIDAGRGHLLK